MAETLAKAKAVNVALGRAPDYPTPAYVAASKATAAQLPDSEAKPILDSIGKIQSSINSLKTGSSQPYTDQQYADALSSNPVTAAHLSAGNSAASLAYAASTGDFSGLVNASGQPFTAAEQAAATANATAALAPAYNADLSKGTADTEATLGKDQTDLNNYLATQGTNFQNDKDTLDKTAADNGVLFSGSRIQQQNNLKTQYDNADAAKISDASYNMGNTARDFQYQYGNTPANGLSAYYNLGSNSYDPTVASGGVTSNGLSSIYNPSAYNYQGTKQVANTAAINTMAANQLANNANKMVGTGYSNKIN